MTPPAVMFSALRNISKSIVMWWPRHVTLKMNWPVQMPRHAWREYTRVSEWVIEWVRVTKWVNTNDQRLRWLYQWMNECLFAILDSPFHLCNVCHIFRFVYFLEHFSSIFFSIFNFCCNKCSRFKTEDKLLYNIKWVAVFCLNIFCV